MAACTQRLSTPPLRPWQAGVITGLRLAAAISYRGLEHTHRPSQHHLAFPSPLHQHSLVRASMPHKNLSIPNLL